MDVYGYNRYQYNPEDLDNQIFTHQALSTPLSSRLPEGHVMPAPSGGPWNIQNLPWSQPTAPGLVTFTGPMNPVYADIRRKRKSLDLVPTVPSKQFITEEKMAAHLDGLHISSDYTSHSSIDDIMDVNMDSSFTDKLKGPKLILSEELKKLRSEPLLPEELMNRLEKPCMSLVVWKPKEDIIEKTLKKDEEKQLESSENNMETVRRGVLVPDLVSGGMDVEM